MKARQDFLLALDKKGNRVSFTGVEKGVEEVLIEKGKEVPDRYVHDLVLRNPDFLDLKFEEGRVVLSEAEQKKFDLPDGKLPVPKPKVIKREHSNESLVKLYNAEGMDGLKKVGEKFNVTDRSHKKLINEILREQEKIVRENK